MKRSGLKKFKLADLTVRRDVNYRDDYDTPSMKEEIVQAGRILEPLHIREDGVVLKGNRRTLASQELVADPKCPQDLAKALEVVDVFIYSELSPNEETELILDHGSQKPLNRTEIVKAVWRLQRQMYSERDIITLLYNQLARYTGNPRKAFEAQQLQPGEPRETFLQKWLHGTVGNYIMAAGQMGEFVREQLLLSDTAMDRALTKEEQDRVKFDVTRGRVNDLASAKKKDKEAGQWDMEKATGPEFAAKLKEFIAADTGPKAPRGTSYSKEAMEKTAESMQSDLRIAFLKCAGKLPEGRTAEIEALDCKIHRQAKIDAILNVNIDRIKEDVNFTGAQVKALLQAALTATPDKFEGVLSSFLG